MNLLYPDPCYKEDSVIKRLHYISTVNVIYFIFYDWASEEKNVPHFSN